MVRLPLLGLALLFVAEGALAQTPAKPAPPKPSATVPTPPPTQAGSQASPRPPKKKPSARRKPKADSPAPVVGPVASSPSFRMLDDGKSRVFVEVSQKVGVTEQKARGRVIYKLKGAAVPVRNSLRPL